MSQVSLNTRQFRYFYSHDQGHKFPMIILSGQPKFKGLEYSLSKFIPCLRHRVNSAKYLWIIQPRTICHQRKQLQGFAKATLLSYLH